ncbi:MAG: hypothetical protein A2099_07500 [Planctomycetes bacterium GWF2_39_10]|nr:MAG: hypothetical protein A2Y09_06815 [Planctomycetes bacterium GWA2_39_15]OHB47893.1 MAG: hypothetical protein A2099_07500 [Planctomycetes bacterium GWF2_39_10]
MSKPNDVIIIGSGSHGVVIADIILCGNKFKLLGFSERDDVFKSLPCKKRQVTKSLWFPIYADSELFQKKCSDNQILFVLGIGQELMKVRARIAAQLKKNGYSLCVITHPSSIIASSATLGEGVVVMAGAAINPFVKLGNHVVVNTGATIDHDCVVGDNSFIQPGVHLAGHVYVGKNTVIGIGSAVKEKIKIGNNSIVGGGAFVNRDVPDNTVYAGVPARKLRNNLLEECL